MHHRSALHRLLIWHVMCHMSCVLLLLLHNRRMVPAFHTHKLVAVLQPDCLSQGCARLTCTLAYVPPVAAPYCCTRHVIRGPASHAQHRHPSSCFKPLPTHLLPCLLRHLATAMLPACGGPSTANWLQLTLQKQQTCRSPLLQQHACSYSDWACHWLHPTL